MSADIDIDSRYDLTNPENLRLIEGWIRGGCIRGIWLAAPCTTWSRARRGPKGSGWGPLRNNQHILGFHDLPPDQLAKVRVGNATMRATARIIRCAVACRVPVFLDNASTSMLWHAPQIYKLTKHAHSHSFIIDFCQHGARWRKRTRVHGWFAQPSSMLERKCCGHGGVCSRTGKYHIVLSGADPVSKQLWAHIAQPYPARFAQSAASVLIASANALEDYSLRCRYGN